MRIAIDVDDVITGAPEFFAAMTQAMRNAGHEIHIVTDFDEHFRDQREKELAAYGIAYDRLAITGDKLGYCRENGIEVAIDDDSGYFENGPDRVSLNLFIVKD